MLFYSVARSIVNRHLRYLLQERALQLKQEAANRGNQMLINEGEEGSGSPRKLRGDPDRIEIELADGD